MKINQYKIILILVITLIVVTLLSSCQPAQEPKPTPKFEFQQFSPTKAPVQPTAIRETVEEDVEITITATP